MIDKILFSLTKPVLKTYTSLLLDLDIVHSEPILKGPKIVVANHPSVSDPILVMMAFGEQIRILIAEEVFKVKPFGGYLRKSGHIEVIPGRGCEAFERSKQLLQQGYSVMIFPEGHLSPIEGGYLPARSGAARLALATGAPVIPVGAHLDRSLLTAIPTNSNGRTLTAFWYFRGPYHITVGKPVQFTGDCEDRALVKTVSNQIMQRIALLARQSARRMGDLANLPAVPSLI